MPSPLPPTVRAQAVDYIQSGYSTLETSFFLGISERQMRRIAQNLRLYGIAVRPSLKRGPPKSLDAAIEAGFLEYIDLHPTVYLDEMCLYIFDNYDIKVSIFTISRFLRRVGWTHKKVSQCRSFSYLLTDSGLPSSSSAESS